MYREFELIERIQSLFSDIDLTASTPGQGRSVRVGIGDDCAVLEPGHFDLISTDTLIEDVHFRRDWSCAEDIGFKALAVSLSDVAAMGGRAGAFLLNLSLPVDLEPKFIDGFLVGLKQACDLFRPAGFRIAPIGGDVTTTRGPIAITTTVLGASAESGAILRSGAQVGDRVVLLGPTGLAQAGLDLLLADKLAGPLEPSEFPALLRAHRRPYPRVKEGAVLGASGLVSAMVDTSDGLLQDLGHICQASEVGAQIWADRVPRHPELCAYCGEIGTDAERETNLLRYLFGGGEDFQLCLTLPEHQLARLRRIMQRERGKEKVPVAADLTCRTSWNLVEIGEVTGPDTGLLVVDARGKKLRFDTAGYEHFAP